MIFGKTKMELQVGIFVFFGLVLLAAFVFMIGKFTMWNSGYDFRVNFSFVNGVKVGAPVRFAGVDVGEVKNVAVVMSPEKKKPEVRVGVWVKNNVQIPADSSVWVNTLGLLGEKYVEIMPGKNTELYLAPGAVLEGTDPVPFHELGEMAKKTIADIDASVLEIKDGKGTVGKLMSDDSIYKEVEALVMDLRRHPWKLFWKTK